MQNVVYLLLLTVMALATFGEYVTSIPHLNTRMNSARSFSAGVFSVHFFRKSVVTWRSIGRMYIRWH